MAKNKNGFRWAFYGITGPFQVVSDKGHVVCTIHGISGNPNKDIPLVAAITRACERHAKQIAKEANDAD